MKITIFGFAGTGKSTIAKLVAKELNLTFKSSGEMFREEAAKLNLSIYEFDKFCKEDVNYDKALDLTVKKYGQENNNFIIDSRLAWYFIPDSIKICFKCFEDVTYQRVAERENISFDEAKQKTLDRNNLVKERYSQIYPHINYPPKDEIFDLIMDTTNLSIEEVFKKVLTFLRK